MTSTKMLEDWFLRGKRKRHTHMIVMCDTFDWEDYPAYVNSAEEAHQYVQTHDGQNMQKVMEVYDLRRPMKDQMQPGTRVFNY